MSKSLKLGTLLSAFSREEDDRILRCWLDENPLSKLKVKQVKKADVVVASHGHNDHIGDVFAV